MSGGNHILLKVFMSIALLSAILYLFYPLLYVQQSEVAQDILVGSIESETSSKFTSTNQDSEILPAVTFVTNSEQVMNASKIFTSTKSDVRIIYSFGNLEEELCLKTQNWSNKIVYRPAMKPCPKKGIVSYIIGGRTGNLLWKYSTIWAIARKTGLEPYVPKCLKEQLEDIFVELSLPTLSEISHCPIEYNTFVKSLHDWQHPSQNIILIRYNFHKSLVLRSLESAVKEFKFRKEIRDRVQEILEDFVKTMPPKQYTFVAVHVRRADYMRYLKEKFGKRPVDPSFFRNAMDYFRNKYPNCLFIYVSDDPAWCFENFGQMEDVYVASYASNTTAAEDLAMMAACNHTIFDYGTFGQWGAILAKGEAVYSSMEPNFSNGSMNNWIMMK